MDTVGENKEDEKAELESGEGYICCYNKRRGWTRGENRAKKLGEERCHEESGRGVREGLRSWGFKRVAEEVLVNCP